MKNSMLLAACWLIASMLLSNPVSAVDACNNDAANCGSDGSDTTIPDSGEGEDSDDDETCKGFDPAITPIITDTNWNNMFPITIAGVEMLDQDGATNPSRMSSTTPCICPGRLYGYPTPGIMVTFFQPMYIAEIAREPGCMMIMAEKSLPEFSASRSGVSTDANTNGEQKRQVHWFEFPLFSAINEIKNGMCVHSSNYLGAGYLTEVDDTWQSDGWASVFAPESALFSSPPAHMACAVDAIGAAFNQPVDTLFWCDGQRLAFPYSGQQNINTSNELANAAILAKFIARNTRLGLLQLSIGGGANCGPTYNPVWSKQQWRIDPIYPLNAGWGRPIVLGKHELLWRTTHNYTAEEASVFGIWRAVQCCAHI